jgi:hypothetical protein
LLPLAAAAIFRDLCTCLRMALRSGPVEAIPSQGRISQYPIPAYARGTAA